MSVLEQELVVAERRSAVVLLTAGAVAPVELDGEHRLLLTTVEIPSH